MKVNSTERDMFVPFTMEITAESEIELKLLWAMFNISKDSMRYKFCEHFNEDDIPEITYDLWNIVNDEFKKRKIIKDKG